MTFAPRRNIELKCRVASLADAREAALRLGARRGGLLEQTDTYFHCTAGRLKLRETAGDRAELIAYARPDHAEARTSEYYLATIEEPGPVKAGLTRALGVRVVVVKRRQLLLWHNVRIHLDEVEGLGAFCEFEAVLDEDDAGANGTRASQARIDALAAALKLQPDDRIAVSYSDLIEAARQEVGHVDFGRSGRDDELPELPQALPLA